MLVSEADAAVVVVKVYVVVDEDVGIEGCFMIGPDGIAVSFAGTVSGDCVLSCLSLRWSWRIAVELM